MCHRKIYPWIGAICFVIVALSCTILMPNFLSVTPSDTEPTVIADWDECHLYRGLNHVEAKLDISKQNELGDLIFNASLKEIADNPIPTEELLYGGPYVTAVFVKDGVTTTWSFNPNRFIKTVTEGDVSTRTCYEPIISFLTKLNNY